MVDFDNYRKPKQDPIERKLIDMGANASDGVICRITLEIGFGFKPKCETRYFGIDSAYDAFDQGLSLMHSELGGSALDGKVMEATLWAYEKATGKVFKRHSFLTFDAKKSNFTVSQEINDILKAHERIMAERLNGGTQQ